jgi:hypothetical protein
MSTSNLQTCPKCYTENIECLSPVDFKSDCCAHSACRDCWRTSVVCQECSIPLPSEFPPTTYSERFFNGSIRCDPLHSKYIGIAFDTLELYKRKYICLPNVDRVHVTLQSKKTINTEMLASLFPNVRRLFISDCQNVDLEPLATLPIETIVLDGTTIIDIDPLKRMSFLNFIKVDNKYGSNINDDLIENLVSKK